MSSKPRKPPRSIAARLVILFTLSAALLLCASLGLLYAIVVRHAWEEDNEVLADKALALRADLESAAGPEILQAEAGAHRAGEKVAYFIRVLGPAGQTVAETPGMRALLPPEIFPAPRPNESNPISRRLEGRIFSLLATSSPGHVIQVAQDRSLDEQFSRRFAFLLVAVTACGTLVSAAIAITVTRSGLRPLTALRASLERVGPAHLHERIPPEHWPRELQPLVATFDQMLDRLEDSFTRLSQFSADLAHELRTPVANLRGEAEVALTRPRTPDEYREVIESSVAECERLSGMIDNLLFLARAEAADETVERTSFDARAAVEKIAAYYETLAEEHGVALRCQGQAAIVADAALFGRAVSNLVENALRHTPAGGTIELAVTGGEDGCEVVVRDDGAGIAEKHLPRIFDRFYRADASRSSEGTGLGLALVKSIMDLHGGTASVASAPGAGTAVKLAFPRDPKAARNITTV